MIERAISKDNWEDFLSYFNDHFKDSIVKIEIVDDENYRVDYAEALPIKEFDLEEKEDGSKVIYITAGSNSSFSHQIDFAENIIVVERDEDEKPEVLSSMDTIMMNPLIKEAVLVRSPKLIKITSALGRSAYIRFHPIDENDSAL
ncbi:MAG TPA: DUF5335 family protein [Ignavibacteriales bacterium]|nr:DUF5335 family protein [Ignavibacteriales bacterium]